ncbi:MAG: XdhC/CoxI family protein [Gemmatimonadetes bacterium]|nr:XdhC/CoxI family protein [Gemmatimonadota bacterium]
MSRPLSPAAAARAVLTALDAGETAVLVVRAGAGGRPEDAGARMVVARDGARRGSLGGEALDRRAAALAAAVVAGEEEEGLHEVEGPRGPVELYLELHHPVPELVVVGAGHIAQPLAAVGALLGFRVTVLDDRPEFATRERFPEADQVDRVDFSDPFSTVRVGPLTHVVLVTRGHKYDYECLLRLLASDPPPRYIGMIGSRRRVRATYEQLLKEGLPRERVAAVRAPVGLDLAAETPAEIAVAVAAEIVMLWRGGTGAPLKDEERVLERFFPTRGTNPEAEGDKEP